MHGAGDLGTEPFSNAIRSVRGGCHKEEAGETWCCNHGRKVATSATPPGPEWKAQRPCFQDAALGEAFPSL